MTKKLILFVAAVAVLGVLAVACAQSPMIVYIVVTATPEGATGQPASPTEMAATALASVTESASVPTATLTPAQTETPGVDVRQIQIYVAEQPFQRGRMFWLEPIGQIWVMVETEPGLGYWQVYQDIFQEGDLEMDPALVPPAGLSQPIRGFGLIWRNGENVRQELGWASDIEVGFITNYEYYPGEGSTAESPVPGYHFMQNQYGDWYRFNEINETWQTVTRESTPPTATPAP